MKKIVAMVAFATALMIGASAMAASVDIFVRQQASLTDWTIAAIASSANTVGNGQIALTTSGFSAMTLCPAATCPQISGLDSILNASNGNLTLTSLAGQNLVTPGGAEVTLATLTGPGPYVILPGDDAFGFTVADQSLSGAVDYSLTIVPLPPVPEPATVVLLGLGLAGLAMVRRSA